ncbi:hypothetical protein R3P38DRAFT_2800236 [Favolaschia claudopus]|uniref:Uncharacterized protein n=1 Tax=Favolaschia claudopus TaxID=2862362 RepID=A0AAV9ZXM3_9AGAR
MNQEHLLALLKGRSVPQTQKAASRIAREENLTAYVLPAKCLSGVDGLCSSAMLVKWRGIIDTRRTNRRRRRQRFYVIAPASVSSEDGRLVDHLFIDSLSAEDLPKSLYAVSCTTPLPKAAQALSLPPPPPLSPPLLPPSFTKRTPALTYSFPIASLDSQVPRLSAARLLSSMRQSFTLVWRIPPPPPLPAPASSVHGLRLALELVGEKRKTSEEADKEPVVRWREEEARRREGAWRPLDDEARSREGAGQLGFLFAVSSGYNHRKTPVAITPDHPSPACSCGFWIDLS